MNIGRAVSVQDDCEPQIVVAIEAPIGREVNSSMPMTAQARRLAPTQTPEPSMKNSAPRKTQVARSSLILHLPPAGRSRDRVSGATSDFTKVCTVQTAKTRDPNATGACAIHSGMASPPSEISSKSQDT